VAEQPLADRKADAFAGLKSELIQPCSAGRDTPGEVGPRDLFTVIYKRDFIRLK
jgi:hypothetical protein